MVCSLTLILSGLAEADVLDFEDLYPGYEAYGALAVNYAGFNWSGGTPYWITKYYAQDVMGYDDSGFEFGTSGNVSIYTAFESDISMSYEYFDFTGAYITSAWNTAHTVTVQGWRNGTKEYEDIIVTSYQAPAPASPESPYWFDFNYSAVDTVKFIPGTGTPAAGLLGSGDMIVIDNITYSYSVIPEPVSSILFVTGGAVIGLRRFWKKRRYIGQMPTK